MKRSFDLLVAAFLSVGLFPVFLILWLMVRIFLGGPALFVQRRPGLDGREFKMYKFRSMSDATGADGELLPDRERLGDFGRFLRQTSLDELPELWNVIRGEMSLVGPRPLLMEYLPLYSEHQSRRHEVRPGITGWAQVNGRNALGWDERLGMDVWYVDNRSFALDLKIIAMTVGAVISRRGVSAEGDVTMPKFTGPQVSPSEEDES